MSTASTVKFVWFNLMPWPHLPADFRQRHRSVWVDIPSSLFDPALANRMYHQYMDQLDGRPALLGHSMGGMIAAEMACLAPHALERLVLVAAPGLWIDSHPIPDLFATLPFDLPALLFHDPARGVAALTGGVDFSSMEALQQFLIGNARRLGTAGKILFPIPNRRVQKRLYRATTPALVLWGREDRFTPALYAERWQKLLPVARCVEIANAGHMLPYEQPDAAAEAVEKFLAA